MDLNRPYLFAEGIIPRVSLYKFSKFMLADMPQRQRMIRDLARTMQDKSKEKKRFDPRGYYGKALSIICKYHNELKDCEWLLSKVRDLRHEAAKPSCKNFHNLKNNAEAIEGYHKYFSGMKIAVMPRETFVFPVSNILITVVPDLVIKDKNSVKLVKFHFPKTHKQGHDKLIRAQCDLLFVAQRVNDFGLNPNDIIYLDVHTGKETIGEEPTAALNGEISRGASTYRTMWLEEYAEKLIYTPTFPRPNLKI